MKNYDIYCSPSVKIPNVLNEIGRLREVTFRAVGEGTNRSIDLDEYDLYYYHLFIWDREEEKIVGAYRVGKGKEIVDRYGMKGFYINSLFKMRKEMLPCCTSRSSWDVLLSRRSTSVNRFPCSCCGKVFFISY